MAAKKQTYEQAMKRLEESKSEVFVRKYPVLTKNL